MKSSYFPCSPILLFIFVFSFLHATRASAEEGGAIYVKQIDSFKYDVYFELLRDCQAISLPANPSSFLRVGNYSNGTASNFKSISISRTSIKDLSLYCGRSSSGCGAGNQSFSGRGIELHTYKATIDLTTNTYAYLKNADMMYFEGGICCTNGNITNVGVSSLYFYTYLNVDSVNWNSTPQFNHNKYQRYLKLNEASSKDFSALDTTDNDSLTYALVQPKSNSTTNIQYNSGYSLKAPIKVYDPGGLGIVNPTASPPIGFYLDPETGEMVLTPTAQDYGRVPVEVREWRKDASGTYRVISVSVFEHNLKVNNSAGNNSPIVDALKNNYSCINRSDTIIVKAFDKEFIPPPPDTSTGPDSVKISWEIVGTDPGFTITLLDSPRVQPHVQVVWSPDSADLSQRNYAIKFFVEDDNCGIPATGYKVINFYPVSPPEFEGSVAKETCSRFSLGVTKQNNIACVSRAVLDMSGNVVADTNVVHFSRSGSVSSTYFMDTLQIRSNGQFVIRSIPGCTLGCDAEIHYDTVTADYSSGMKMIGQEDTFYCGTWSHVIYPDLVDTTQFYDFLWNTPNADTTAAYRASNLIGETEYILNAKSPNGCPQTDTITIISAYKPEVQPLPDILDCDPIIASVDLSQYTSTGGLDVRYLWSDSDQREDRPITVPGYYSVAVLNECGFDTASFIVNQVGVPQLKMINDTAICSPINAVFRAEDMADSLAYTDYVWDDASTADVRKITAPGSYTLKATNFCGADSLEFEISELFAPSVDLGNDTVVVKPFSLRLAGDTSDGDYLWSTGETTQTILVSDTGEYWLEVTNKCGSDRDTIVLTHTLSVNKLSKRTLEIYPNPNEGTFTINLTQQGGRLLIYDINGKLINSIELQGAGEHLIQNKLAKGVYQLEVHTNSEFYSGRLVVK